MRIIIARIDHEGYGCVQCQKWHDSGSLTIPRHEHYDDHLYRQSKHGITRFTETHCWSDVGGELVKVPAGQLMVIDEI